MTDYWLHLITSKYVIDYSWLRLQITITPGLQPIQNIGDKTLRMLYEDYDTDCHVWEDYQSGLYSDIKAMNISLYSSERISWVMYDRLRETSKNGKFTMSKSKLSRLS